MPTLNNKTLRSLLVFIAISTTCSAADTPDKWKKQVDVWCSSAAETGNCNNTTAAANCCDLVCLQEGKIVDSTIVTFRTCPDKTSSFVLTTLIDIANKQNIRFQGSSGNTTLQCNGNNQTGITFSNITNLYMENFYLNGCGVNPTEENTDGQNVTVVGSLNIINCVNVTMTNVTIHGGYGVGLVVTNTTGEFILENSNFTNNIAHNDTQYTKGGGMFVNIGSSQMNNTVSYIIKDCTFTSNKSPASINKTRFLFSDFNCTQNDLSERGGGLHITIEGDASNNNFNISGCKFSKNSAPRGGGMFVVVKDSAKNNTVTVHSTVFVNNNCQRGGGALQIGYIPIASETDTWLNNRINIHNCTFEDNRAKYGGGVAVFSTFGSLFDLRNEINFTNCTWRNNSAQLATAVDISVPSWETYMTGRYLPSPVFSNCMFVNNSFRDCHVNGATYLESSAFVTTGFRVMFEGRTQFISNCGTAIYAMSSTIDFATNSNATFLRNSGITGGALALIGLSVFFVRDNSTFLFEKNTAIESGGAIYFHSYDLHLFTSSKTCFVQHQGDTPRSVSIAFKNNKADYSWSRDMASNDTASNDMASKERNRGNSLFATTFTPCLGKCAQLWTNDTMTVEDSLQCIADFNFNFDSQTKQRIRFSTDADHFMDDAKESNSCDAKCPIIVDSDNGKVWRNDAFDINQINDDVEITLPVVPGKSTPIPLKLVDDLCREIYFIVKVRVKHSSMSTISINSAHAVITDKNIILYGKPKDNGTVELTTASTRKKVATLKVEMSECPPGYVIEGDERHKFCECSADTKNKSYIGIERCNNSLFQAYVKRGYWVGYLNESLDKENDLATAICPRGYCLFGEKKNSNESEYLLPPTSTLGQFACSANRIGRLCGRCTENSSAYYHSMTHVCGSNNSCHLGWIFYILTELVPVTILFVLVILCNISFTSGATNGVIFFMQVIDTMKIDGVNFIWIKGTWFRRTYKFIYRMFSSNFFALQELSFCLQQGASGLDLLAIKYITILYGLVLIIITVLVIKLCNFKNLCRRYKKFKDSNFSLKRSIIHGLSAFLVISYSECTRVSILILTQGTLRFGHKQQKIVAFYNGEYEFFGTEHLTYAIPALMFIIAIGIIPPALLLGYPLCYKLFALLRIEESRCLHLTCKIFPLEKFKPVFDSFQGTFKDRFRCFAGLYFFYRLFALLIFSFTSDFNAHCTMTGITLIFMLGLHAACRPYKLAWHNVLDAAIFANLAIINTITFYNFSLSSGGPRYQDTVEIMSLIQGVLIILPLIYLGLYTAFHCVHKLKAVCVCKKRKESIQDSTDDILDMVDHRILDESLNELSDYHLLNTDSDKVQ